MNARLFQQIAVTAFLEPLGFETLYVWRISAQDLMEICTHKPQFDVTGDIEALLLGADPTSDHPAREALEHHMRRALTFPESPEGIECGSTMGKRAESLLGATARSIDIDIGFLDLLIYMPLAEARLPKPVRLNPVDAMIHGFTTLWAQPLVFCGVIEDHQWDTYIQRAHAVMALIERNLMEESSGASGHRTPISRL